MGKISSSEISFIQKIRRREREKKTNVSYFTDHRFLFLLDSSSTRTRVHVCTSRVRENFFVSCIHFRPDSARIVITRHSSRNRRCVLLKNNTMSNGVQIRSIQIYRYFSVESIIVQAFYTFLPFQLILTACYTTTNIDLIQVVNLIYRFDLQSGYSFRILLSNLKILQIN